MKDGDISNEALAIGVDYNSIFDLLPRSKIDDFLFRITRGRYAAIKQLDKPKPYARYALTNMQTVQRCNIYHVLFAPVEKWKHLEFVAWKILNKFNIPVQQVDVIPDEYHLLEWIKENNITTFYSSNWRLLQFAGKTGHGFDRWEHLM